MDCLIEAPSGQTGLRFREFCEDPVVNSHGQSEISFKMSYSSELSLYSIDFELENKLIWDVMVKRIYSDSLICIKLIQKEYNFASLLKGKRKKQTFSGIEKKLFWILRTKWCTDIFNISMAICLSD